MKYSLSRAFILSLLIFLMLNFLFYIIGYSMIGLIDATFDRIADHPSHSIYLTVFPVQFFPWELLEYVMESSSGGVIVLYLGGFISFIIAAIIAGIMGDSIGNAIGGWFLTAVCYILLFIIMLSIDDFNLAFVCFGCTLVEGIVQVIIPAIVNTLIFGILVLIIAAIKSR